MRKVFVSGCYDIIHGGHIQFFKQAKALGDYLIVCIASEEVLKLTKSKPASIPTLHKISIIESLDMVDEVLISSNDDPILDFKDHLIRIKPYCLVSTEDDKNKDIKENLCNSIGVRYFVLDKTLGYQPISTTDILKKIKAPTRVPLRVDISGGWLDVPKFSDPNGYVVNLTIDTFVSLNNWGVPQKAGLGGSAAWAILNGNNPIESEFSMGVGWQDPAIISETGLCAWRSGVKPILDVKTNPDFITNIALLWTGSDHDTPALVNNARDYDLIRRASIVGYYGVLNRSLELIQQAVHLSYKIQLEEGMNSLPNYGEVSKKYCGGGFGGYALYFFNDDNIPDNFKRVKPYIKYVGE